MAINELRPTERRGYHSGQCAPSLQHFAESAVRAYKVATTPSMAPMMLSLDAELQENPISVAESLRIPKFTKVERDCAA